MRANDLFDMRGEVAIVTGAAGGIGRAIAEVLAANGATLAMLDNNAAALEVSATDIRGAGGAVEAHVVDVVDRNRLRSVIDDIVVRHGACDAFVANAGITGGPNVRTEPGAIEMVADAAWDQVIATNLSATFYAIQAVAKHMKVRRSGRIVAVASIAGMRGDPMVGYSYAASKAGVVNLVRQASWEFAPFNVTINAIAPGPFRTNIAGGRINKPEVEAMFAATVPLNRIAHTDEIKGLALLLASRASSYMTGAVIPIDGGTTAT